MIKVRGFQVAPPELEAVLLGHPSIIDCAVIGLKAPPNSDAERPRAYVVRREGTSITEDEVHALIRERLAKYKQLTGGIKFLDEIPKSPSGKVSFYISMETVLAADDHCPDLEKGAARASRRRHEEREPDQCEAVDRQYIQAVPHPHLLPSRPVVSHLHSTKLRLLVRTLDRLRIPEPVLGVELHSNRVVRSTTVQAPALDTSDVRHDLELGVERGATGAAEPMLVDLARRAYCVVGLRGAFADFEVRAWDDDVGCVCGAGPEKMIYQSSSWSCRYMGYAVCTGSVMRDRYDTLLTISGSQCNGTAPWLLARPERMYVSL